MKNDENLNIKGILKKMAVIAVPIIIQTLITATINLVDTVMIGQLGEKAIASLGITNQIFILFNVLAMAIFTGVGVLISQFWGKEKTDSIADLIALQIQMGLILAIIFWAGSQWLPNEMMKPFTDSSKVVLLGAGYLRIVTWGYFPFVIANGFGIASRSLGKTFLPMLASSIGLVVNVIMNYGLIYGHFGLPRLEVQGAALATTLARTVEMLVMLWFVYKNKSILSVKIRRFFKWHFRLFNRIRKPVFQVVVNDFCWGIGVMVYIMLYGKIGTGALASVQIMGTVQQLFFIVLISVSHAACVMIGNGVGAGNKQSVYRLSRVFIVVTLVLSVGLGLSIGIGVKWILSLFHVSREVQTQAQILLYLAAVAMPIRGLGLLFIIGILRGGGDAKRAMQIELFTIWFLGVPLCYVGAVILKWPVGQVYILVLVEEIVKLILAAHRFYKGEWIQDFTHKA